MNGILFGDCGCCHGSLTGESQVAYGYAPYFMGWVDINTSTFQYMTELARPVPDFVWLTLTSVYTDRDSGAYLGTIVDSWSNLGIETVTGSGRPPGYTNPVTITKTLSNKYYLKDAAGLASGFCDQIGLLSPNTIYQLSGGQYNGAPHGAYSTPPYSTTPTHFCYPSEAAQFPGQNCVNTLFCGPSYNGTTIFTTDGWDAWNYGDIYLEWGGDFTGGPSAWSGLISLTYFGPNIFIAPYVVVKKTAVRGPTGYTRRIDYIDPVFWHYPPGMLNPVSYGPGEHIFLPTDVPGLGYSLWDNGALPPLPPPP